MAPQLSLTSDGAPVTCAFFGVYDGHGGRKAAEFCGETVHKHMIAVPEWYNDPLAALRIGMPTTAACANGTISSTLTHYSLILFCSISHAEDRGRVPPTGSG